MQGQALLLVIVVNTYGASASGDRQRLIAILAGTEDDIVVRRERARGVRRGGVVREGEGLAPAAAEVALFLGAAPPPRKSPFRARFPTGW